MNINSLLKNILDLNLADYDGRTPLHLAVEENNIEVVRYLIEKGVDKTPKDRWGNSPIDDLNKKNET